MSNKNYTVYMHVNKINNKRYIGITRQIPQKRWANGLGYRTQPFYKAIKKYGWDSFEHHIIYKKLDYKQACIYERELISQYNTTDSRYGYNCSEGGEDVIVYYNNLVHNNKIVYQYSFDGKFITSFNSITEAVKSLGIDSIHASTNISSVARGETKSAYGFIWSYEYLGESIEPYDLKFSYIGNHRKIYKYDLDGKYLCEYYSILEASREINLSHQSIIAVLDKENRICGNFQWRTYKKEDGILKYVKPKKDNSFMNKKVIRISKDNQTQKIFNSIKEACIETTGKDDTSSICKVLKGERKTAFGYKWAYYNV